MQETAAQLQGHARRRFMVETVGALGWGGQRLCEFEVNGKSLNLGKWFIDIFIALSQYWHDYLFASPLEDSRLRVEAALERLYLVAALALLYATTQGVSVQIAGFRQQVAPHWRRGISYLKMG